MPTITYNPPAMKINKVPTKIFLGLFLLGALLSPTAWADTEVIAKQSESDEIAPPISLATLAAEADVVALVQMRDGDYRYQREFPVSGSAYLKMLIPYKVDQPLDMVEVYEFGLHPNECYFPDATVFEEGRRYLVFLRRDSDDEERYRGMSQGCALDVLVTTDNSYVLRIPATGIALSDNLLEYARKMEFADPYAHESDETLDSAERDAWLDAGWLRREVTDEGQELIYTQGVSLNAIRTLLGPEGVSLDRHQKRLPSEP